MKLFVPFVSFHMLQASSSGKYVDSCLDMLVCNFTPPKRFVEALKWPHGVAKKDHVLSRVHSALEFIAGLVPLAPSRLLPIVLQRMPKVFNNVQEPVSSELCSSFERDVYAEFDDELYAYVLVPTICLMQF